MNISPTLPVGRAVCVALAIASLSITSCARESWREGMVDAPVYDYGTATRPASARAWGGPAPETLETPEGTLRKLVFYSDTYDIDRIYKSMQGPATTMELRLSPSGSKPELIWLKGVRADVVGEDGTEFGSQEFMCHVVAAVKSPRFDEARKEIGFDPRFATLSQGQYFKEFPEGFGTPILSGDIIQVASQVLNFNERERRPRVRHRIVVLYMRDSERRMPMQALRGGYAQAMVRLGSDKEGATYGVLHPDGVTAGASCSPGDRAQSTVGVFPDRYGRLFSGHWVGQARVRREPDAGDRAAQLEFRHSDPLDRRPHACVRRVDRAARSH